MPEHTESQIHINATPDSVERLALDIKAAIKSEYTRGEPSAQLIDRLLILALHGQATAIRKVARLVDPNYRDVLRDAADDTDPFLR